MANPASVENVQIKCSGYSIAADWHKGSATNRVLLALHGYSSSKAQQENFVSAIVDRTGMSALAIDYSGHGESPFELRDTRPAQHFLEVVCAFDWLTNNYPDAEIAVVGSSYGSFLATLLTNYREFEKLVLRAPAIYKPETFYDLWAIRVDDTNKYNIEIRKYREDVAALAKHPLLARTGAFKGKTLVVVHGKDEIVPVQTTDAYTVAFGADNFIAEGFAHNINSGHTNGAENAQYQNRIANWLQ